MKTLRITVLGLMFVSLIGLHKVNAQTDPPTEYLVDYAIVTLTQHETALHRAGIHSFDATIATIREMIDSEDFDAAYRRANGYVNQFHGFVIKSQKDWRAGRITTEQIGYIHAAQRWLGFPERIGANHFFSVIGALELLVERTN